jgi:hypothetical protein
MKDNCNKQATIGLVQIAQMSDTDTITLTKGEVINLFKAYMAASYEKGLELAKQQVKAFERRARL